MSDKITVVIAGGLESRSEEQKDQLLEQIRLQLGDSDLEWQDLDVVDDPEITKAVIAALKEDPPESADPYQKYWDELALKELMGEPRTLH